MASTTRMERLRMHAEITLTRNDGSTVSFGGSVDVPTSELAEIRAINDMLSRALMNWTAEASTYGVSRLEWETGA